jgi:uncharacterized protein YoxC
MPIESTEDMISKERVRQLEEAVLDLSASIQHLTQGIQEMQKVIIRIATNQQQLAERVATWPFIQVERKSRRRPGGSIDKDDI